MWQGFGSTTREDTPIDRLRRAAWELAQWRDFDAPWTRPAFDRHVDIDRLVERLHAFAALTEAPSYAKDFLYLDTAAARHLSAEIAIQQDAFRLQAGENDYDGWEARLVDVARDRHFSKVRHGRGPGYKAGVSRQQVLDAHEALKAALDQFRLAADADLAAALQRELRGAIDDYERLKARAAYVRQVARAVKPEGHVIVATFGPEGPT